ncbi:MAG: rhomboid family intramembrane serine protease [Myxococcales bacterium]|nr:rhomboid family intramembrane serine protease [Myxococcales bacterium]
MMTPHPSPERLIRLTLEERRADDWDLVLRAEEIPHRLEESDAGWALVVGAADAEYATRTLDEYERERRDRPSGTEPSPAGGSLSAGSYAGAVVATLLAAFFLVTGPQGPGGAWFDAGSAAAGRILQGEPWRVVTALTLHADPIHLLGNAVALVIFFGAIARWLGVGLGGWLVLLSGAVGNALNALAHGPRHVSIGASTAVFGAVGILALLQLRRRRKQGARRMRAWISIGGGLALFAMLGTAGDRTDVLAHLFGLLAGGAIGAVAAWRSTNVPRGAVQALLAVAAVVAIAICWWMQLRGGVRLPW